MKHSSKSRLLLITIILLSWLKTPAQDITFSGAIVIDKTEVMSYTITYQLSKNNELTGYSTGDLNGKEETKSLITGKYDPKRNTLTFEEKKILNSKAKTPVEEFCLMKVQGKIDNKGGKTVFTGNFNAFSLSNEVICASGTLILLSEKDINELSAKTAKVIKKLPQPEKPVPGTEADTASWSRKIISLESGETAELELKSNYLILELVDDRFQDGDKISVLKNGVRVINNLEITNKVQTFKYEIATEERETTFSFIAAEEGSIALTTFKAVIINGRENNLIKASLNKGESVKVILKRK
ncbi:MAG: hypothetical protein RBS07_07285 [Lentimicrobium sp.]|jgi:hypothetical protein|nr:hypothetical protein [Lentimicrobium sp.]